MSVSPEPGVTYSEMRWWACELVMFTASDLADAMGVDQLTAQRAIAAFITDGICVDSGDVIDGVEGYETIVEYIELPSGPTTHETGRRPEDIAAAQVGKQIIVPRGTPIRIRTERQMRKSLSTPGARQHHLNREREYQKMMAAREASAKLQKLRADRQKATPTGMKTAARAKKKANKKK